MRKTTRYKRFIAHSEIVYFCPALCVSKFYLCLELDLKEYKELKSI